MDLDMTAKTHDDSETDTPPRTATAHPIKPLSYYSAAAPKTHAPPAAAYKECMKNHAATIGGHAVDGCGEFLPPPPSAAAPLKCAACGCHRSFHRRDPDSAAITPPFLDFRHPLPAGYFDHQAPVTPTAENPAGRKRFRTRFSQEQKEKMQWFSGRLGWRMQRCDEAAVKEFCQEIGVTKGVLKVWMHNNKNNFVKRVDSNNGGLISSDEDGVAGGHFQNKSNGSSSS